MKKYLALLLIPLCLLLGACGTNDASGEQPPVSGISMQPTPQETQNKKGFYTVTEAYENGLITRDQVMSIAYYHLEDYPFLKKMSAGQEITSEGYTPLSMCPETLSAETQEALKQTYLDEFWKDEDVENFESAVDEKFNLQIEIKGYYGTFNDCIAVMMTDNNRGYITAIWAETVDDVKIYYNDGNRIMIWKN